MPDLFLMIIVGFILLLFLVVISVFIRSYQKIPQGKAIVRTGVGGMKVSFNGMMVFPVLHQMEIMDISLKSIEVSRTAKDGLICKDNMRADIKVVFFIRVNKTKEDVETVAQTIGTERASDPGLLYTLFEAKFSEGLKTIGKRFDFVDLYDSRERFKVEILDIVGTDLNGYILDDCAIDYLEQTDMENLEENNILDAEGIKKITELTATQKIKANKIRNEERRTIKQQDVETEEQVLELERQLSESTEKQRREVAIIKARENAETERVEQEERLKGEQARLDTEEKLGVKEQNKYREIIAAEKNKEKTDVVETERVLREQQLEVTERERVVELAQIEKERSIEEERKNIQDVIRERVIVQKAVVEEEEKTKDIQAFAAANRKKEVAIKDAEEKGEQIYIGQTKTAEANKKKAELEAEQRIIEADSEQKVSEKKALAIKTLADASASERAATGLAEAQVMEAKAAALEKQGEAEAGVIEQKNEAEAHGIRLKGEATAFAKDQEGRTQAKLDIELGLAKAQVKEKDAEAEAKAITLKSVAKKDEAEGIKQVGFAEAEVLKEKAKAEAMKIEANAEAMKKLNPAGVAHEEFKIQLATEKEIRMEGMIQQKQIAEAQARVLAQAFEKSNINIVGGETLFYNNIIKAISQGQYIDQAVGNSKVLQGLGSAIMSKSGDLAEVISSVGKGKGANTVGEILSTLKSALAGKEESKLVEQLLKLAKTTGQSDVEISDDKE